jgi:hypothetical protein
MPMAVITHSVVHDTLTALFDRNFYCPIQYQTNQGEAAIAFF